MAINIEDQIISLELLLKEISSIKTEHSEWKSQLEQLFISNNTFDHDMVLQRYQKHILKSESRIRKLQVFMEALKNKSI